MTNIKLKLKQKVLTLAMSLGGVDAKSKLIYYHHTGRLPNLSDPQTWGEKMLWLNHHWQPEVKSLCADKYRVREFIRQKGLENVLIPLLGVWNNAQDIDFDSLPDKFVLKCNHGCAMNILVTDKEKLNRKEAVKQINRWLKVDLGKSSGEAHYSKIKPCVIAEAFLPVEKGTDVVDFKIHCFNGKPKFITVCTERDDETGQAKRIVYSTCWERMMVLPEDKAEDFFPKPLCLPQMIELASELAEGFPYVRVDLYVLGERIFFGELTFSPNGNIPERAYTVEACREIGSWLDLSVVSR